MTCKEYKVSKSTDITNNFHVLNWKCENIRRLDLSGDNREVFLKVFGSPEFHFRGEFDFHCWTKEFEGKTYIILTAKTKGTCYEILEDFESVRGNDGQEYIRFFKQLQSEING